MKVILGILLLFALAESANWLMLQSARPAKGHTPWGFVQVKHERIGGESVVQDGLNKTPFSYVAPSLQEKSQLSLSRFRLGIRGALDDENKINYDFLTEFAPNGVNKPLGYNQSSYIVDSSITLKYLPLYLRIGKFKYPGSEEGLSALYASPLINFTTMTNQLLLERFVSLELSEPTQGVGAFRDSGVQVYQTYELAEKNELTLAYMYGNGSGTANKNVNRGAATHYGYLSYENILGKGKGHRLESLKFSAWAQSGKRYLLGREREYERKRRGVGVAYFDDGLRLESEYVEGEGMIGNGVKDVSDDADISVWRYETLLGEDAKASGYYLSSTYELTRKIELLARYDRYDRITNNKKLYRVFETLTTGFSYKFKNYNRIDVNYDINSVGAPYNSGADSILQAVGNQLSIQFTILLK